MVDKLNGNFGNVNGFLFGKKVDNEETAKTEAKKDVPVGQTQAPQDTAKVDKTNLNLDMNAILGLHLTKTGKVDTSERATAARATEFYASADFQTLNKEFGIYNNDIDPEIGQFLSPKTLSYMVGMTPEQQERIETGTVREFDNITAAA